MKDTKIKFNFYKIHILLIGRNYNFYILHYKK